MRHALLSTYMEVGLRTSLRLASPGLTSPSMSAMGGFAETARKVAGRLMQAKSDMFLGWNQLVS